MNAKKLLLLILALCLVVCLAACGGNTVDQGEKPEKPDGGYEGGYEGDGGYEHTTHNWRSWELRVEPTYEATGTLVRDCEGCSENETHTLPKLNANDYKIINAWYPDEGVSCANESIYAQFVYTIDDAQNGAGFEIVVAATSYSPEHPEITSPEYTVWTTENHYPICSVCGRANTKISEAHTMENGECTVCHYTPDSFIYDENAVYSTGVSYTANEETVVIPTVYGGSNPEKAGLLVLTIDSFENNTSLKSITIPATVDFISTDAFSGCEALENVYYEGTWEDWCDIRFGNWKSTPMFYASNFYMRDENGEWAKVTEINIPDTVTEIGDHTFVGFVDIEKLTIPASVIKIGHAFCDGFASAHNGHGVYDDDGWWTGSTCDIDKVYYGGSVEKWCRIDFGSFGCPLQKTSELYLFEGGSYVAHTTITEIDIPADATAISAYQFKGFTGLERVKAFGALTEVGDYAFYGCSSLVEVNVGIGCKELGREAFYGCTALDTIHLPADLKSTGYGTFTGADAIDSVYYNGTVADWCGIDFAAQGSGSSLDVSTPMRNGKAWFYMLGEDGGYYSIYESNHFPVGTDNSLYNYFLVIPESVTEIGDYQFYGFDLDESVNVIVVFEGDVTGIGEYAFANAKVDYIFAPKSLTGIGYNAFKDSLDSYANIYYEGSSTEWASVSVDSSVDLSDVDICYYADSAEGVYVDDTYWCFGSDGYVYEWVYSSTEDKWVATLNKALSRGVFTD